MTNNLEQRIIQHYQGKIKTFTYRYQVNFLVYYESSKYINNIIMREKEIKGWSREKKEKLINSFNPNWDFLNEEVLGYWPLTI